MAQAKLWRMLSDPGYYHEYDEYDVEEPLDEEDEEVVYGGY